MSKRSKASQSDGGAHRKRVPYLVLVVSILVTLAATYYLATKAREGDRLRFLNLAQQTQDSIEVRMEAYIAVLRATAGLFDASDEVTLLEFRTFVSSIDLPHRYPGIQGVGFSRRVVPADRGPFVAAIRRRAHGNFTIRPDGERSEYHAIVYLEPLDRRNQAAIGYDMSTEPVRRAAMERARDTGLPSVSGRVTLVQEIDEKKQAGFLIYVPVYRHGMPLETVADRRAALEGYAYSPFRGDDLLHGILGVEKSPEIAFQLFAGPEPRPEDLIYGSAPAVSGMPGARRLETTQTFRVVDSTWSLAFAAQPAFDAGSRRGEVALLLVIGVAISGMLFAVIRSQVRARGAAERVAADLARQAREMQALAETGRSLSEALDLDVVGRWITESLRSLVSVSRVTLYRLEPQTGDLIALAKAAVDPAALAGRVDHVPAGTAVIGRAVEDRAPVSTVDLLHDSRIRLTPSQREHFEPTDNRAVLAVPLIVRDRVIGALSLGDQTGRVFSEEEIRLVRAFADQAALALHNAQVYAETEQARGEATELAHAARDLTETLDVAAVGARIVERVLPLFSARLAIVRALEPDGSLRAIAANGPARAPFGPGHVLPAGIGLMSKVATEGRPIWTADVRTDTRIARSADYTERLEESGTEAALAVPLRAKGRMIGVLGIADAAGRVFSDREVALLQAFADQAAVALENARLFAEEKQAEEAARDARDRLRALIEASPVAIITLDERGLVQTWNPAATTLFGWTADEVLGRPLPTVPEERQGEFETHLAGYRRGEAVTGVETKRRRKDGSVVDVVLSVAPITDAEGRPLGSIGVIADVTQRKQLEQQLVQAQKMEAVGQLAGGVAHDFNNLLTVIGGRSALLLQRGGLNEATLRDVELIGKTAERAAGLTRQLLAFSRKQVLEPKPVDLNALVGGVAPMLRRLIGEHIELVIVPGNGLGHVMADPGQVEQVIMNLIVNARDAMPDGGMVKIETASRDLPEATLHAQGRVPPGRYVTLRVQDTGCGMDSVTLARIFEPFFTTKEPGKGTGLGLSTVHGIVHQSGGHIGVDSTVGRGTTFAVYLPRITEAGGVTEAPKTSPRDLMRGSEVVLVVEDEEEVRRLASEILTACGYTVLETGDPLDALTIAERRSGVIDLLVTDMVLPAMRGSELAERLGTTCRGMRILYMSGYTDEMIAAAGANESGRAFLQKPFTPYDLARKVREALTRT